MSESDDMLLACSKLVGCDLMQLEQPMQQITGFKVSGFYDLGWLVGDEEIGCMNHWQGLHRDTGVSKGIHSLLPAPPSCP